MRCFALPGHDVNPFEISAVIDAHNASLPGDTLTLLVINHRWRRLLGNLASVLLNRWLWTGTEAEIDDAIQKAHELLWDLYTVDGTLRVEYVGVRVRRDSDFSVTTLRQNVPFDNPTTHSDTDQSHAFWTAGNPDVLIVPDGQDGWYRITANVQWQSGALALMQAFLRLNNNTDIAVEAAYSASQEGMSIVTDYYLEAGDFVSLNVLTTVNRDIIARFERTITLTMTRMFGQIVPTS